MPPLEAIDARGAAFALLLSILWGANPVAIKLGLEDTPPIRLAWMRFLVGGAVIVVWGWATGRLRGLRIRWDEWRPLLVLGALFTAQIGSMNIGTGLTSAAHARAGSPASSLPTREASCCSRARWARDPRRSPATS